MTGRLHYCDTCQVSFTGPSPAQQHYDGQKHKKNEEALKTVSELCFEFNKVCNVPCGTQDLLKWHQNHCPHQQLPTKCIDQFAVQNRVPDIGPLCSKLTRNSDNADICKAETSHLQLDETDELANRKDCQEQKYYDMFDGTQGCCHLCKIGFTSVQHAKQHLNGQKHLKAVGVAEGQKKFYENSVAVCHRPQINANFGNSSSSEASTADMSFHQHHLPSSSLCSFSRFYHSQDVNDMTIKSDVKKTISQDLFVNYPERQFPLLDNHSLSISLNLKEDSLNSICLSNEDKFKFDLGPKPTPENLLPYECPICNKKLNSLDQLILHKNGHLNKAAPKDAIRAGTDNTIWLSCPLCKKLLNSVKSLRVHFVDGHKMTSKETDEYFDEIGTYCTESPAEALQKSDIFVGHINVKCDGETNSKSQSENPLSRQQETFNYLNSSNNKITKDHCFDFNICNRSVPQDSKGVQFVKSLGDSTQQTSQVNAEEKYVDLISLPNNKHDKISKGCGNQSCLFHCHICAICLNSVKQRDDHKIGSQHIKKLHGTSVTLIDARYHCELCNASMNTQTDYEKHCKGQQHALNATRKVRAPVRDFGPEYNYAYPDKYYKDFWNLTTSKPRSYQVELYQKAMKTDTVCFLPTGTGKTLVSILVMSCMLQKYPGRPVVFLVDKILLVLQQCDEIKKEIGNKLFQRWNESKKQLEERKLRIAMLCRGKQDLNENEVWQQDVIVITAAYYYNLLKSESLRWTDNCLVIFDEAHHCVKRHPYKQILETVQENYKKHPPLPKILGLTASPAGRNTVKDTLLMLRQLLLDFGENAELVAVEGTNELTELKSFKSNTELMLLVMTHSTQETIFCDTLRHYILECWMRLKQNMKLKSGEELEAQFGIFENVTEKNIGEYLQHLNSDTASQLADGLDKMCDASKEDGNKRAENFFLQSHIKNFCQLLVTLETLGMELAIKDLYYDYVQKKNSFASFSMATELHLPCEKLKELINYFVISGDTPEGDMSYQKGDTGNENFLPIVHRLVTLIVDRLGYNDMKEDKSLALILVRRRNDATRLTEMLSKAKQLNERNMKVICVTGHGSGKDGMTVFQQEKVLTDIREHKYNVIVATSVAEEGLDMPLCELVVQLSPPDTVRALVQIRGRARKKGSQFVAFCQTMEQKNSFEELLKHEEHMISAVKELLDGSNNY